MKISKTKVLFRLRSMETGGVQKVLCDIMKNIPSDLFEITLLLNLKQGEMLPLIPENVKVFHLAEGKEQFSNNPLMHKLQLALRRVRLEVYHRFPQLIQKLIQFQPDVEIAFTSSEFDALLKSPFKKSKKIGWFHADIRDAAATETDKLTIIRQLKQMDTAVFVSQQTRNIIKEVYHEEIPKGLVIYNPFEHKVIKEKAHEFEVDFKTDLPVFISLGRLIPRKGNKILVEAHKILINKGLHHKIWLFGNGQDKEELLNLIKEYSIEDSFIIKDPVINPYPYLNKADFYVLPSKSEAYPLVIGEALILEKPVVATNAGGVKEMMDDGINGTIVEYDATKLAEGMERFLTDKDWVETIKFNNKTASQRFDNQKIYNQIIEVLKK
ncbi:glycosyltransferase [Chryseobacterium antibioticum]|uniref:Glycosyltransferase n=1 Tax=Chryseobacterium pyrolae TaxID=2987481 RepID=A0ABT2IGZ4_9FLAO|nr:glycosyltransferase [Chryseobacterium pyrolae]MCT2407852.1 glycosyltransferase [Chryseobacterium pyrolae]